MILLYRKECLRHDLLLGHVKISQMYGIFATPLYCSACRIGMSLGIFSALGHFILECLGASTIHICKRKNVIGVKLKCAKQSLSQNLGTGCPKWLVVNLFGVLFLRETKIFFKGDHGAKISTCISTALVRNGSMNF